MVSMGKNPFGFTIIEVMIVLASTGALLLIAFAIINGEVSSTSYQNSIRSLAIEMQNIANQTTSGQYAFSNSTNCDGSSNSLPAISSISGGSGQGTSTNCTFLGKLVVIGTDNKSFDIYPVAGIQCTNWSGGSSGGPSGECQSPDGLNKSFPVVDNLDPTSYQLGSGLEIRCIFFYDISNNGHCLDSRNNTWPRNICSFGFFYSNNASNTSSEADLYPIDKCQNISPSSSQPNNYPCSYIYNSDTETSSGNDCNIMTNSSSSVASSGSPTPAGPAFLCNYYDFSGDCQKAGSGSLSYQSTPAINICVFNTNNSNQTEDIVINSSSNSGTTVQGSAFSVTLETNSLC